MKIAIIPARIGSKRISKKNIRLFCNKPLIAHIIALAKESQLFDRVIISTDSEEIAEVALNAGGEVPFMRPENLADDYTSTMAVMKHATDWLHNNNIPAQYICCLYATAVLLTKDDLYNAYEMLKKTDASYVFSVIQYSHPIQRALLMNEAKQIKMSLPKFHNIRTQDLEKHYYDAGQFYWGKVSSFSEEKPIFNSNSLAYVMAPNTVIDIDTLEDFHLAETLYKKKQERNYEL